MVRSKSTCCSLAMHEQGSHPSIHHVLLNFGNIVRHVVDGVHVQVIGCGVEQLGEGLSTQEGHRLAIDPRKVCCKEIIVLVTLVMRHVKERKTERHANRLQPLHSSSPGPPCYVFWRMQADDRLPRFDREPLRVPYRATSQMPPDDPNHD